MSVGSNVPSFTVQLFKKFQIASRVLFVSDMNIIFSQVTGPPDARGRLYTKPEEPDKVIFALRLPNPKSLTKSFSPSDCNHIDLSRITMVGWLVGWLCLTSHRQRGHLETAPPFTVPCEGREAR